MDQTCASALAEFVVAQGASSRTEFIALLRAIGGELILKRAENPQAQILAMHVTVVEQCMFAAALASQHPHDFQKDQSRLPPGEQSSQPSGSKSGSDQGPELQDDSPADV